MVCDPDVGPPRHDRTVEHELIAAVLHVGIVDAVSDRGFVRDNVKMWERQAILWIFDDVDDAIEHPFSFPWCCAQLDLNPEVLRQFVRTANGMKRKRILRRCNG